MEEKTQHFDGHGPATCQPRAGTRLTVPGLSDINRVEIPCTVSDLNWIKVRKTKWPLLLYETGIFLLSYKIPLGVLFLTSHRVTEWEQQSWLLVYPCLGEESCQAWPNLPLAHLQMELQQATQGNSEAHSHCCPPQAWNLSIYNYCYQNTIRICLDQRISTTALKHLSWIILHHEELSCASQHPWLPLGHALVHIP